MNRKKQDSCGFCKKRGYSYNYCSHRKENTIMGAKCALCENNNNISRLRERIERAAPITNMTEAVKIDTNADNK